MDFSKDNLRKRFHELTADADKLNKKLDPLREELADLVSGESGGTVKEALKREPAVRTKIKELNEQLFPIEMERAALARALGGQTGSPDE